MITALIPNDTITQIFPYLWPIACGGLGWFVREQWDTMKELKNAMAELERELPTNYVKRDDYREDLNRVFEKLDKIIDKMDSKADKAK